MLHFVGFRKDKVRFTNAVKIFGKLNFIHYIYDARAVQEIQQDDFVVFANGDENSPFSVQSYNDSEVM